MAYNKLFQQSYYSGRYLLNIYIYHFKKVLFGQFYIKMNCCLKIKRAASYFIKHKN